MLKIIYLRHERNPLNQFLERQFEEANLEGYEIEKLPVDETTIDKYNLTTFQTILFTDKLNNVLLRIENPLSSSQLEDCLQTAKGLLSNQMKRELII